MAKIWPVILTVVLFTPMYPSRNFTTLFILYKYTKIQRIKTIRRQKIFKNRKILKFDVCRGVGKFWSPRKILVVIKRWNFFCVLFCQKIGRQSFFGGKIRQNFFPIFTGGTLTEKIFWTKKNFCRRIVLIRWNFVYLYKINSVVKFLDWYTGVKSTTVKITGQILAIFG